MYETLRTSVRYIMRQRAEKCGWYDLGSKLGECIGSGAFGAAWQLPCGNVLKIGRDHDTTLLWVREAALRRQQGKALALGMPRVFHLVIEATYWWAVMEFVTPRSHGDLTPEASTLFSGAGIEGRALGSFSGSATERAAYESVRSVMEEELGVKHFHGGDMHAGNWGLANDGRIVVFDPDSGSCSPKKQTIRMKRQHGPSRGRWAQ